MANAIEQTKREMYSWLKQVKMLDQGGGYQINSATALGNALGERAVDRLREGGGIALVFNWDSERKNLK